MVPVPPLALKETLYVGGAPTVTVTDWSAEVPPGPVHWKVKVVLAVRGSVRPLPLSVAFHGLAPAVQLVALVELQVRVDCPAYATGLVAERVAVGAADAVHCA